MPAVTFPAGNTVPLPSGAVSTFTCTAAPAVMLNVLLVAAVRPLPAAVKYKPAPTWLICKPGNVAAPELGFWPVVPLESVPPCNVSVIVGVLWETLLPYRSPTCTTGLGLMEEPAAVFEGWVLKLNLLAALADTVRLTPAPPVELVDKPAPSVAAKVAVSALCATRVAVATPLAKVMEVAVPRLVPLTVARELSGAADKPLKVRLRAPLKLLIVLPLESTCVMVIVSLAPAMGVVEVAVILYAFGGPLVTTCDKALEVLPMKLASPP